MTKEEKLQEVLANQEKIKGAVERAHARINRKIKFWDRIGTRIAISVFACLWVSLLVLSLIGLRATEVTALDVLYESSQNEAKVSAQLIARTLMDLEDKVEALSINPLISDPAIENSIKDSLIVDIQKETGFKKAYFWIENNNEVSTINIYGTKEHEKALSGQSAWTTTMYNDAGELIIRLVEPLYNSHEIPNEKYTKQIIGGLVFDFDPKMFSTMLAAMNFGENGSAFVLDNEGTTIATSYNYDDVLNRDNDITNNKSNYDSNLIDAEKAMVQGESGYTKYKWAEDNSSSILGYAPIANTGWSIGIDIYISDFTGTLKKAQYVICGVFWLFFIIAFILSRIIARSVEKPVKELTEAAKCMSNGDFSYFLKIKSKSEFGVLAEAFILTIKNIRSVTHDIARVMKSMSEKDFDLYTEALYVGEFSEIEQSIQVLRDDISANMIDIQKIGDQVGEDAEFVSNTSQTLAQGSAEQAGTIDELSKTLNSVYLEVKDNTESSRIAAEKTTAAGLEITNSNAEMAKLVEAMNDMTNKSNEIQKIVKTIEDIAFQTNILALNAAVEAARAGVAGKGFAVVADEVRNLATKSSEAASETTKLIEETIHAIDNGNKIANSTADTLKNVVVATNEAVNLVNQISEASERQAKSINEVTIGIGQISSVVSSNSATAQEAAASSEELNAQADKLKNLIDEYNLFIR